MKIRFARWMPERPIRELAALILDHSRKRKKQTRVRGYRREMIQPNDGMKIEPIGRVTY